MYCISFSSFCRVRSAPVLVCALAVVVGRWGCCYGERYLFSCFSSPSPYALCLFLLLLREILFSLPSFLPPPV